MIAARSPKTQPIRANAGGFLAALPDARRHADCMPLQQLHQPVAALGPTQDWQGFLCLKCLAGLDLNVLQRMIADADADADAAMAPQRIHPSQKERTP